MNNQHLFQMTYLVRKINIMYMQCTFNEFECVIRLDKIVLHKRLSFEGKTVS